MYQSADHCEQLFPVECGETRYFRASIKSFTPEK